MCATLMAPEKASDAELMAAIERKLKKFGSVKAMPKATRELIIDGLHELHQRAEALKE